MAVLLCSVIVLVMMSGSGVLGGTAEPTVQAAPVYLVGSEGLCCYEVCASKGMNCHPAIITNDSANIFAELGANCTPDPQPWCVCSSRRLPDRFSSSVQRRWAEDQPSFSNNPSNPLKGKCLGYINVPQAVSCSGFFPTTQRLCACDEPDDVASAVFGTGYSNFNLPSDRELVIFSYVLPSSAPYGVITHWWATAPEPTLNGTQVRFYVDGETSPSIEFFPPLACGVGFQDQLHTSVPWGTQWFGKGAKDGSWFLNFRIPFQRSIRVTEQQIFGGPKSSVYTMVRGAVGVPITIGYAVVPPTARLRLFKQYRWYQPLDFVPLVDLPSGDGLFFMSSLAVQSGSMNMLEGCFHMVQPLAAFRTRTVF
jgi:hypothetical protein